MDRRPSPLEARERLRSLEALAAVVGEAPGRPGAGAGPLAGVPVVVKDVFVDHHRQPTMGSNVHARGLRGTATVIERLRVAGADVVAYTNCHEWSVGTTSVPTARGPIRNPWDPERIAGGSSGGSAVAVATGIVPAAVGTDTGGSVRVPAACCGVVGLKPTFGAIPLDGVPLPNQPFDHVGVIAGSVGAAIRIFDVLADRHTAPVEGTVTFGIARQPFFEDVDPRVEAAVHEAISALGSMAFVEVEIPRAADARVAVARHLLPATRGLVADRFPELQPANQKLLGTLLEPADDELGEARAIVETVRASWTEALARCDVVVTPALPAPPATIASRTVELPTGTKSADVAQTRLSAAMNVAGVPSMAIPCGEAGGMPTALTLTANHGREDILLSAGKLVEDALDRAYVDRVAPID